MSNALPSPLSMPHVNGFAGARCHVNITASADGADSQHQQLVASDSPAKRAKLIGLPQVPTPTLAQRSIYEVSLGSLAPAGMPAAAVSQCMFLPVPPRLAWHVLQQHFFVFKLNRKPRFLSRLLDARQATREALLADSDDCAQFSPLSPGGPDSSRRLAELFGLFRGNPLERTGTEGPDELLSQVRLRLLHCRPAFQKDLRACQ